jgi:hypothetical protein
MKNVHFTIDSTTGYYDLYAPIYDWNGYIFNAEGDVIPEELYIPYECII